MTKALCDILQPNEWTTVAVRLKKPPLSDVRFNEKLLETMRYYRFFIMSKFCGLLLDHNSTELLRKRICARDMGSNLGPSQPCRDCGQKTMSTALQCTRCRRHFYQKCSGLSRTEVAVEEKPMITIVSDAASQQYQSFCVPNA